MTNFWFYDAEKVKLSPQSHYCITHHVTNAEISRDADEGLYSPQLRGHGTMTLKNLAKHANEAKNSCKMSEEVDTHSSVPLQVQK